MKATLRGTEIYFDIAGMQLRPHKNILIEKPVLFMLHGGPGGDHLRYKIHSQELEQFAQLIMIDHRGCGRSKKTKPSDYTLENNIEDIEALRQYLGLKQIALLGTSYGGVVAQGYAVRYPKNLHKLILVATAPSFHFIEEAKRNLAKLGTKQQIQAAQKFWAGSFKNSKEVADFFKKTDTLYSVAARKKTKSAFGNIATIWSHEAINLGFSDFLRKYNFLPQLKKIKCPTLVLAGDEDWICSANQSRAIAARIPQATLKIFKQCSHAIGIDAHKQYIKTIRDFLKK